MNLSCGLLVKNSKENVPHMHGPHTRTARPPGRPDERASYQLYVKSLAPASSVAEPPPAATPQLGRWTCQQGLRSARMRCLLLVLAAVLLLLRRRLLVLLFYVWSHFVLVFRSRAS